MKKPTNWRATAKRSCAEPFTKHMTTFSDALRAMGPADAKAQFATAVRGAVSGLGLLNLVAGLFELRDLVLPRP